MIFFWRRNDLTFHMMEHLFLERNLILHNIIWNSGDWLNFHFADKALRKFFPSAWFKLGVFTGLICNIIERRNFTFSCDT